MTNKNDFSLIGLGSSVRYGKGNGIIAYTSGTGFGIYNNTGTVLASLLIGAPTATGHAVTLGYLGSNNYANTAGNGITLSTGTINLNFATGLGTAGALGTSDIIAVSQNGTVYQSTIGSLASEIAGAGISSVAPITDTSGTIALNYTTRLAVNAGSLDLGTSGVTAGTFGSGSSVSVIGVDTYGRVVSASSAAISITDTNVASGANISLSKLAPVGTNNVVLISGTSGIISPSAITTTTLSYLDATSSIQGQLNAIGTTYLPLSGGTVTGAIYSNITPTTGSSLVNKTYVDGLSAGVVAKQAVVVATTGSNITLSGTQTIDGVAVTAGQRVLVKDQTTASQNGIYIVAAGAWTRSTDFASGVDESGAFAFVTSGTVNHGIGYVVVGTPNVVGTNNITFTQFSQAGAYTAGSGLSINTSGIPAVFSVNLASNSGLNVASGLKLDLSTLTAGGTLGTANTIAINQSGTTVSTTLGSLASLIASSGVSGTGAISVSGGTVSLATSTNFAQTGGSLSLVFASGGGLGTNSGTTGFGISPANLGYNGFLKDTGSSAGTNTGFVVSASGSGPALMTQANVVNNIIGVYSGTGYNQNINGNTGTAVLTGLQNAGAGGGYGYIGVSVDGTLIKISGTNNGISNGTVTLGTSGVTAGTYGSGANVFPIVTVDAYGRVTSATTGTISAATIYSTAIQGTLATGGTSQTIGTIPTISGKVIPVAKVVVNVDTIFTGASTLSITDGTTTYMLSTENDITTTGLYVAELPMTVNSTGKTISATFDVAPTAGHATVTVRYELI